MVSRELVLESFFVGLVAHLTWPDLQSLRKTEIYFLFTKKLVENSILLRWLFIFYFIFVGFPERDFALFVSGVPHGKCDPEMYRRMGRGRQVWLLTNKIEIHNVAKVVVLLMWLPLVSIEVSKAEGILRGEMEKVQDNEFGAASLPPRSCWMATHLRPSFVLVFNLKMISMYEQGCVGEMSSVIVLG